MTLNNKNKGQINISKFHEQSMKLRISSKRISKPKEEKYVTKPTIE